MLTADKARQIEVWLADKGWRPCDFGDLEPGDIFRAKNPDGSAVEGLWRCTEHPTVVCVRIPEDAIQ